MILESIGIIIAGSLLYNLLKKRNLSGEFNNVMKGAGVKNHNDNTYKLRDIKKTNYGYCSRVMIPNGKNHEELEELKTTLEDNLKASIELENKNYQCYMKVIENKFNNVIYTPVKLKPNEIFLGYDISGKITKVDMHKHPHVLIAGLTGSGKSRLMMIILTNLI